MNLFAHNIGTYSITDLDKWNVSDLGGDPPYIMSTFSSVTDYTNISTIEHWDMCGELAGVRHCDIRTEIKSLYAGTTWSSLTTDEKKVVSKYFIVGPNMRDEVLLQSEQDEYNHFKLYHFLSEDVLERLGHVNPFITPKSIDYKKDVKQRLHPEFTFDNTGFLTDVVYYETLGVTQSGGLNVFNFSNPIVSYKATYNMNSDGYVTDRTIVRKWQLMDNTWSPDSKTSFKIYDSKQSREEGNRRRHNLINNLLIDTVGLFYLTSGDATVSDTEAHAIPFLQEIDNGIKLYYESGAKEDSNSNPCLLIQQVSGSTYSRLDNWVPGTGDTVSIKMFIISRLDP